MRAHLIEYLPRQPCASVIHRHHDPEDVEIWIIAAAPHLFDEPIDRSDAFQR